MLARPKNKNKERENIEEKNYIRSIINPLNK